MLAWSSSSSQCLAKGFVGPGSQSPMAAIRDKEKAGSFSSHLKCQHPGYIHAEQGQRVQRYVHRFNNVIH